MPAKELEAVVHCPRCREDRFEVWRVPVEGSDGVYQNVTNPPNISPMQMKACVCGSVLERRR